MKVLRTKNGALVTIPMLGGNEFQTLDGEIAGKTAVVDDIPQVAINTAITGALKIKVNEYFERKDFNREFKFFAKVLADVAVDAEVGLLASGRGYRLDVPEDARPNRTEGLAKGAAVAIGPHISPKALMNARGVVESLNGTKATVLLDEGDLDRVNRATGKSFSNPVKFPKTALEVLAA